MISIDGTTGRVYLGEVPVRPSEVVQYFEGDLDPATGQRAAGRRRAPDHDARRRAAPAARCAPTPTPAPDAARARRFGAQGIGLCRTEHMFLGDRRELVERLILADGDDGAAGARWPRCSRCSGPTSWRSSGR